MQGALAVVSIYKKKPNRFFDCLHDDTSSLIGSIIYCAGFEYGKWRCEPFADHLVEWLPDYALLEEELGVDHGNAFIKLKQAAARVYTSAKHKKRGEAGEIALHAICREFFDTIPISPRVFYKSASNDPVKSFDLVHARFPKGKSFEIWLGESKLYANRGQAIAAAITSIKDHIKQGFLKNEKLLLGPQISRKTPRYRDIMEVFQAQASIDNFLNASVFVIGILANSRGLATTESKCDAYVKAAVDELGEMLAVLSGARFATPLRLVLIYVPLNDKNLLTEAFDKRLKGLQ